MVVFTDLGRMVTIFFLCFLLIGYVHGSSIMFMLAIFCLAIVLVSTLLAWLGLRGVSCRRKLPGSAIFSSDPLRATIHIHESHPRWRLLKLYDHYTNLITQKTTHRRMSIIMEGRGSHLASIAGTSHPLQLLDTAQRELTMPDIMRFARRGHYRLGPMTIYSYDPFGLLYVQRTSTQTEEVIVYPHPLPIPDLALAGAGGRQLQNQNQAGHIGESADFYGIRPYVEGDDLRRVHWKSTAHTGKLAVKEYEYQSSGSLQVLLDLHADVHYGAEEHSTLETAITLAASLLNYVLGTGNHAGLLTTGKTVCSLAPESGQRQLHRALETLALARADGAVPLAQALASGEGTRAGRCTTVVISPTIDKSTVAPLLTLRGKTARLILILLNPYSFHAADEAVRNTHPRWSRAQFSANLRWGWQRLAKIPERPLPTSEAHEDLLRAMRAAGIEVHPVHALQSLHEALQGISMRF